MKRLVIVITLAVLLVGLVLLGLSDTHITVADTSIHTDGVTNSISKTGSSSASATITITTYT